MIKNFLAAVACFFLYGFFSFSSAQVVSKAYSTTVMQAFLKGKTYAVLTDDAAFNQWFQATLKQQWTVNPLEFISSAQLDSFVMSDKNFFLFAQAKDSKTGAIHLLTRDDIAQKKECYFVLSQGGYKQSKLLFATGTTGSKVLGSFRYGPDRGELAGGLVECEIMLSFLNQSLQTVIDKKIKSVVKDSVRWVLCEENASQIHDKVLLINRSYNDGTISLDDKPIIADKVLSDYPYDFDFVGKDSVRMMLDDESQSYCYLFFYYPSAHFKTIDDCGDILVYDPKQKKILYFDDNLDGPWFEKWKMKAMVSAIKAK